MRKYRNNSLINGNRNSTTVQQYISTTVHQYNSTSADHFKTDVTLTMVTF